MTCEEVACEANLPRRPGALIHAFRHTVPPLWRGRSGAAPSGSGTSTIFRTRPSEHPSSPDRGAAVLRPRRQLGTERRPGLFGSRRRRTARAERRFGRPQRHFEGTSEQLRDHETANSRRRTRALHRRSRPRQPGATRGSVLTGRWVNIAPFGRPPAMLQRRFIRRGSRVLGAERCHGAKLHARRQHARGDSRIPQTRATAARSFG